MRWSSGLTKTLLLLAALCCAHAPGRAAEGPISSWGFDGSIEDRDGNVLDNLTAHGGEARFVGASDAPGAQGKALALGVSPQDSQYLTAPASADVRLGPSYTIEAWILPLETDGWKRLVLSWSTPPNYAYHLAIHDGMLSLCHNQARGGWLVAEGGALTPGLWHHVAGIARRNDAEPEKSAIEVYLNGQLVASTPYDGTIAAVDTEGLGIGDSAAAPSASARFRGYVDAIAIWDRPLAAAEIRARYDERAPELREIERALRQAQEEHRAALRANCVALGAGEIVFAERHPGRDISEHYYANFGYSCGDPDYWMHGLDGGRLCKLNVATGEVAVLLDDAGGAVRDPQVHYDAQKILFSYRKGGTHNYNLYEIGVDGAGLRQITSGPWDDVEPAWLPDGGIVFCSTRCKRYIGCWLAPSAILFRCDAEGENLRMLSSGNFTENTPAVLPDGRVLYTRWEYVNRDAVSFHHLWTMNPDGSGPRVYFGNMHPGGVFIDAIPIPKSDGVALIHSPGHGANEHAGTIATLTAKRGPDDASAMVPVSKTADFRDPYPLSPDAFLAAQGNRLAIVSASGAVEVLHTAPNMLHEPRPIARRPREPSIPSQIDPRKDTGTVVLANVYAGRNMGGVARGDVKKLLVLEDLPKPANFHGGGSQPIGHGVTSTLKRILGTVPVESDGSAHFEVPAARSIYFAILDSEDRSIKQMRTFVTLQPGETLGCVGCHEQRTQTPALRPRLAALGRPPSRIEPIATVPAIPDFPRDVQPILDRHCVKCHNYEKRSGSVALTGDRGPVFSQSYYALLLHWQVKDTSGNPQSGTGRQNGNDAPYATYSSASPLMQKIDGSHHNVTLTTQEADMVRLWIDTSAQYPGTYAAYGTGQVGGCWRNNEPIRVMADAWPSTAPAAEAIERRCGACHDAMLPRHVTALTPVPHGDMLSWLRPLSRFSRHRIFNLSRPEKSLVLLAPLARAAGGYAEGEAPPRPVEEDLNHPPKPVVHPVVFADAQDPDYRKVLEHVRAAKAKLDEIKRFDMPGFKPNEHYVREMKRFGILPQSFDLAKDAIDVYETDRKYWESMWHIPQPDAEAAQSR